MPSTYAHYRMGQEVIKRVPEQIQKVIYENKQLYDIGLHGPDILFYYHPLAMNKVNTIGYDMHKHSGRDFFEYAAQVIKEKKQAPEYLAYVYGFINHFALDVSCHGYIDRKIAESGISHAEIEVEFDRNLMLMDGLDPITQTLTEHIVPSEKNAGIITDFFQDTDSIDVQKALKGMIHYNHLLLAPSKLKRRFVYTLLRISGNYEEMHGLIVNYRENPACIDSTERLRHLYDIALERAANMIGEYHNHIAGEQKLNEIYRFTFGGKEIEDKEQKSEN